MTVLAPPAVRPCPRRTRWRAMPYGVVAPPRGSGSGAPVDAPDLVELRRVAAGLAAHLAPTPLLPSPALSALVGREVLLKCEALQPTGSFKVRGALAHLLAHGPRAGVIAASAGNHAQGVARAAATLGLACDVVMPAAAPDVKQRSAALLGARVHLVEGGVESALARAAALAVRRGLRLVHPFDDRDVVLGQASVALEILDERPDTSAVLVPAGGGGLLAGTAAAVAAAGSRAAVVGAAPAGAPALARSLLAGELRRARPRTFADGLRVEAPGRLPLRWISALADTVVPVAEEVLLEAMRLAAVGDRLVLEPAGAAGIAALLAGVPLPDGDGPVVVVASGGNVDPAMLAEALR